MASEDRGAALASALQPMIAAVVLAYILPGSQSRPQGERQPSFF
jgi:hypothetical protein